MKLTKPRERPVAIERGVDADNTGTQGYDAEMSAQGIRRDRRRWKVLAGAVTLGAVVAACAGFYLRETARPAPQPPCGACVSDGSRVFAGADPAMRAVLAAIAKENAAVRARTGRPYVSVMLLDPMTGGPGSDVTPARMADELRGAYLAQLTANAASTVGIQLLLDDEGTSAEAAEGPAVRQLMTMEGAPDHVVAVAGLGVSTAQSAAAAAALARNHMPMFGAVISADEFNGGTFPGMVQVVPDVAEQVAVLDRKVTAPRGAVLVYDQQASDYYTRDLRTDFSRTFARSLTSQPQPYTPGVSDTGIEFKAIADEVCYTSGPPPVVFYAGRASVLAAVIRQFQADSNCRGKKITMMTAGDADGLSPAVTAAAPGKGQVSVVYTDIVNLSKLTAPFRQSYERALATADPGASGLSDTWTEGTYNAMEAAWTAIQAAYEATAPHIPTKGDVLGLVVRLNGKFAPAGAAGPIPTGVNGELTSPGIPIFEDEAGHRTTLSP
jgi:hypothetical protein